MDRCVLLTSTPGFVVSPRRVIIRRGETIHSGVDVNNIQRAIHDPLNEVGAAPNGDASTTYEWSIISLPTKAPYIRGSTEAK